MSTEESENDPLRGQGPGAIPYREIYRRAAAAAAAEVEAVAVRGSQILVVVRERYWMSSRERLRAALKEPPYLTSTSIHLSSFALHPPASIRASLFQLPYFLAVRAMRDAPSVFPLPLSVLFSNSVGKTPRIEGRQLSYPICPYFS